MGTTAATSKWAWSRRIVGLSVALAVTAAALVRANDVDVPDSPGQTGIRPATELDWHIVPPAGEDDPLLEAEFGECV